MYDLTFRQGGARLRLSLIERDTMKVKDFPRCNNLVTRADVSGRVACCLRVASFGITLADGTKYFACLDCLAKRLTILADNVDTAKLVFFTKG